MTNATPSMPLDPDPAQLEALNSAVMEYVGRFYAGREHAPALAPRPADGLIEALHSPPSEHGVPIESLLATLDRAVDTGFDTAAGSFLSYIPTGGVHAGAIGAFLGAVTNRYTAAAHASPGAVALEQGVIDWMISLFGMPDDATGVLLSGGSIANLTAVVAARTRLGRVFDDGVVYMSEWAHHSVAKATHIAGITDERLRSIPTDDQLRIDPAALRRAISADRAAGLTPMMIVATAGVTDSGSVDPLERCGEIASAAGAWFHVDAAYGGFFQLTGRGRDRLRGISSADSITVDAHKSLLLPFGVGGLLVRDRVALVEANRGSGAYMQDVPDGELPHFASLSPEMTRPNRGLMIWMALHLHGVGQFRDELDRMLDLASWAADEIRQTDGLELACDPDLSIVVFRSTRGDHHSRRIFDRINRSGVAHVSSTTIDGLFTLRLAFLSQRTTTEIVQRVLEIIKDAAAG